MENVTIIIRGWKLQVLVCYQGYILDKTKKSSVYIQKVTIGFYRSLIYKNLIEYFLLYLIKAKYSKYFIQHEASLQLEVCQRFESLLTGCVRCMTFVSR